MQVRTRVKCYSHKYGGFEKPKICFALSVLTNGGVLLRLSHLNNDGQKGHESPAESPGYTPDMLIYVLYGNTGFKSLDLAPSLLE